MFATWKLFLFTMIRINGYWIELLVNSVKIYKCPPYWRYWGAFSHGNFFDCSQIISCDIHCSAPSCIDASTLLYRWYPAKRALSAACRALLAGYHRYMIFKTLVFNTCLSRYDLSTVLFSTFFSWCDYVHYISYQCFLSDSAFLVHQWAIKQYWYGKHVSNKVYSMVRQYCCCGENNILSPERNGWYFADNSFEYFFLTKQNCIFI